jgi:hypothetical protein
VISGRYVPLSPGCDAAGKRISVEHDSDHQTLHPTSALDIEVSDSEIRAIADAISRTWARQAQLRKTAAEWQERRRALKQRRRGGA